MKTVVAVVSLCALVNGGEHPSLLPLDECWMVFFLLFF